MAAAENAAATAAVGQRCSAEPRGAAGAAAGFQAMSKVEEVLRGCFFPTEDSSKNDLWRRNS